MAVVKSKLDAVVAHMPAVKAAVAAQVETRGARVQAVVDAHIRTGAVARSLRVETNKTDGVISIADPLIISINYGHKDAKTGRRVPGIHAIEAAL